MFGHSYFGASYYGPRYFGPALSGVVTPPITAPESHAGADGNAESEAAATRLYYELLRAKRARQAKAQKDELERSEQAKKEEQARLAYEAIKQAKPKDAAEVVEQHVVRLPHTELYEIDWEALVADYVAMALLKSLQAEMDDEEALLQLIANEI